MIELIQQYTSERSMKKKDLFFHLCVLMTEFQPRCQINSQNFYLQEKKKKGQFLKTR